MRRILTATLAVLTIGLMACGSTEGDATPDDGNKTSEIDAPANAPSDQPFRDWFRDADTIAINEGVGRHVNAAYGALEAVDLPAVATHASQAADGYDELSAQTIDFGGRLASTAYQAWTSCASTQRSLSRAAERGIEQGNPQAMQLATLGPSLQLCMDGIGGFMTEVRVYDAAHDGQ